jgi:hypothetical protein
MSVMRRLDGIVPATVHCEVLTAVWSPQMCLDFLLPDEELEPKCVEFKRDLIRLLTRHPKLHTLYLLDPSLEPSGLRAPGGYAVRFRGDGASFYEIDPFQSTEGWLAPQPDENHLDVFGWARELNMLLIQSRDQSRPDREVQVKVLACVPDLTIRTLVQFLKSIPDVELDLQQMYLIVALLCWLMVAVTLMLGLGVEVLDRARGWWADGNIRVR